MLTYDEVKDYQVGLSNPDYIPAVPPNSITKIIKLDRSQAFDINLDNIHDIEKRWRSRGTASQGYKFFLVAAALKAVSPVFTWALGADSGLPYALCGVPPFTFWSC